MNKPLAVLCAFISAVGLVILGVTAYHAQVYGHGSYEAGNFTQHVYWTKQDPKTGDLEHNYAELPTGEGTLLAAIDTWMLGTLLLVGGVAVFLLEETLTDRRSLKRL